MKLSTAVKPISYIKTHASEVVRDIAESGNAVIITLNGEAKAVLQDIREYEKDRESMAMLKILAMSRKSLSEGRHKPAQQAFADVREKIKKAAAK